VKWAVRRNQGEESGQALWRCHRSRIAPKTQSKLMKAQVVSQAPQYAAGVVASGSGGIVGFGSPRGVEQSASDGTNDLRRHGEAGARGRHVVSSAAASDLGWCDRAHYQPDDPPSGQEQQDALPSGDRRDAVADSEVVIAVRWGERLEELGRYWRSGRCSGWRWELRPMSVNIEGSPTTVVRLMKRRLF